MTNGEVRDQREEEGETAEEAQSVFQGLAIVGRTALAVWAKLPQMRNAIGSALLIPTAILGFAIVLRFL